MKRYFKYIFISLILLQLNNSCTNLDETVYSNIVAEQFKPTEADLFSVAGPSYTTLRGWLFGWHGNFDLQEECSDEIVTPVRPNGWNDGGVYKELHYHTWTSDHDYFSGSWSSCYTGINYCNKIIYQIENGTLPIADETKKNSFIAEMKVLRAFYYYILCDNFGNVPISTQWNVPSDFLPDQSTRQQVYDFIIKEVKDNIDLLSEKSGGEYYGRVNKWFAHTLLAKMYLNAEVYTGTAHWADCVTECDAVIASGLFSLEPNFKDVFKVANENSKEIIFAIPFKTSDDGRYGWFHLCFKTLHPQNQLTYDFTYTPWGGNCGIPQFIDSYSPSDKRLKSCWISGTQFSSAGDTLYCTMDTKLVKKPLAYTNYVQSVKISKEYEGFRIGKFEIEKGIGWGGLSNDFPLFRYGDIYMMKAECLLREGDAGNAAALVTQVRARDFDNPADALVTGDQLMQGSGYKYGFYEKATFSKGMQGGADVKYGRMLDELGWEFCAEARRRQDMIRFGVFTTKSWLSHVPNGDYRSLFPIPQKQLETNNKLVQNPGY